MSALDVGIKLGHRKAQAKWNEPKQAAPRTSATSKPDWYWGFWDINYKIWFDLRINNRVNLDVNKSERQNAMDFADAACAERMKREKAK
jgi:hypothetical protein